MVGQIYQYGKGVLVNYGKAISYYQHAAELGSGAAKYKLGRMSHYGLGRPSSYSEAFQWYSKAANHNNGDAQFSLGYLYEKGQGVPQNNAFSMCWYQLAERNGSKMANAKVEGFRRDHIKPESPYKVKSKFFFKTR
jgi:TPR repeat protein